MWFSGSNHQSGHKDQKRDPVGSSNLEGDCGGKAIEIHKVVVCRDYPEMSRGITVTILISRAGGSELKSRKFTSDIQQRVPIFKSQQEQLKFRRSWFLNSGKGRNQFESTSNAKLGQKRDIVDTSFHASRAFGHNPILGLGFPHSWETVELWGWIGKLNGYILNTVGVNARAQEGQWVGWGFWKIGLSPHLGGVLLGLVHKVGGRSLALWMGSEGWWVEGRLEGRIKKESWKGGAKRGDFYLRK